MGRHALERIPRRGGARRKRAGGDPGAGGAETVNRPDPARPLRLQRCDERGARRIRRSPRSATPHRLVRTA
ncbi:hypothetical protein [Lysobacter gummosus]|uniref:hypothetical protein n=1 Tax=Lysobacter gummosus TaxID=262324 RepID=UPI003636E224